MKTGVLGILICLFTVFSAFPASGGQAVYYDENNNEISATQYEKMVKTQNKTNAAKKAMFEQAKKAHKEKMRLKREAAKAESVAASKSEKPLPGDGNTDSVSIIDNLIKNQRTCDRSPRSAGTPKSNLNTYDYYSYRDFFNLAEDVYKLDGILKMVRVNTVWHEVKKYGPDKYKIGKRRPDIKNIDGSHNSLNKKKTGGYRGK